MKDNKLKETIAALKLKSTVKEKKSYTIKLEKKYSDCIQKIADKNDISATSILNRIVETMLEDFPEEYKVSVKESEPVSMLKFSTLQKEVSELKKTVQNLTDQLGISENTDSEETIETNPYKYNSE